MSVAMQQITLKRETLTDLRVALQHAVSLFGSEHVECFVRGYVEDTEGEIICADRYPGCQVYLNEHGVLPRGRPRVLADGKWYPVRAETLSGRWEISICVPC